MFLTALSPLRESFIPVGYELLPLLPNCRTGRVYDLMAAVGFLFFLKHSSTRLQGWRKALWTKLRRQTLTFYEYDRLNNNLKSKWLLLPLNILCCYFKSAPQTGRQPCFRVLFFSQIEPPCLSRKPKRAESEIPSLPEAGATALPFEMAARKDQRASPEGAAGPYSAAAP